MQKPGAAFRPGVDTVLKDIPLCLTRVSMSTNRKLQNGCKIFGCIGPMRVFSRLQREDFSALACENRGGGWGGF
jgi:hypothetical protein